MQANKEWATIIVRIRMFEVPNLKMVGWACEIISVFPLKKNLN